MKLTEAFLREKLDEAITIREQLTAQLNYVNGRIGAFEELLEELQSEGPDNDSHEEGSGEGE